MTIQRTTGSLDRVAEATLRVRVDEDGGFHFTGEELRSVLVTADGDVHVRTRVGADAVVELRFELDGSNPEADHEFAGIQLSSGDQTWDRHPKVLDTDGAFYRDGNGTELPFQVAPSAEARPLAGLILLQGGGMVPEQSTWPYRLHVRRGGRLFAHDPKIYNEGDGGDPR